MIQQGVIISLQILAIYMIFQKGMIAEKPRAVVATWMDKAFGLKLSKTIQKPIWGCLVCMGGIWTIALTLSINFPLIFVVVGINTLISKFIRDDE